jgi:hypothetical protein
MSCSAKPRSTHLEFLGLLRDEIKSMGSFGRNTRYFHEKAARVKPFFLVSSWSGLPYSRLPTNGRRS